MKQILAVSLVTSIVWTTQASAQPSPSTLARSITTEATRSGNQATPPAEDRWVRVINLEPGATVTVVAGGVRYAQRYLISATDRDLLVLNVVEPLLPRAAQLALIRQASNDPAYFDGGAPASEIVHGSVSMGPSGIFVNGRKMADFTRVVERFDRAVVTEVGRPNGSKGTFSGDFGGLLVIGGALAGTIWGVNYGHDQFKSHQAIGGLLGGIGGYVVGLVTGTGAVSVIEKANGSGVLYRAQPVAP